MLEFRRGIRGKSGDRKQVMRPNLELHLKRKRMRKDMESSPEMSLVVYICLLYQCAHTRIPLFTSGLHETHMER